MINQRPAGTGNRVSGKTAVTPLLSCLFHILTRLKVCVHPSIGFFPSSARTWHGGWEGGFQRVSPCIPPPLGKQKMDMLLGNCHLPSSRLGTVTALRNLSSGLRLLVQFTIPLLTICARVLQLLLLWLTCLENRYFNNSAYFFEEIK